MMALKMVKETFLPLFTIKHNVSIVCSTFKTVELGEVDDILLTS